MAEKPTPTRAAVRAHLTKDFLYSLGVMFPTPAIHPKRANDSAAFWYEAGQASVVDVLNIIAKEDPDA